MTEAVREASLEVKKVLPDPSSWAALVLQGAGVLLYDLVRHSTEV